MPQIFAPCSRLVIGNQDIFQRPLFIDSRPKRNGSMRHGREVRRHILLGTPPPAWGITPGIRTTRAACHTKSVQNSRMPGDFTTFAGISGSSVPTGLGSIREDSSWI